MELPTFFTTPTGIAVIAAGASFVAGLSGAVISSWTIRRTHKERLQGEERLVERRFEFDKELAEKRFALDSAFADRKRHQDLAEEVLSGFYQVRDLMQSIRSPASTIAEAEGRPRFIPESESVARQRDTYYVIIARFEARRESIANLMARRYRMAAWFGPEAKAPFQMLHEAIDKVRSAATSLMDWSGRGVAENDPNLWRSMEERIWSGVAEPDQIEVQINEAVKAIEEICCPALEGRAV